MDQEFEDVFAELKEKAAAAWVAAKPDALALLAQAKSDFDSLIAQAVQQPSSGSTPASS